MSEEKFTKGVWEVGGTINGGGSKDYVYSDDAAGSAIAKVRFVDVVRSRGECIANSHLIAAAPEMYGLLKRLLNGGCLVYGDDIDSVEDLLAKARGES